MPNEASKKFMSIPSTIDESRSARSNVVRPTEQPTSIVGPVGRAASCASPSSKAETTAPGGNVEGGSSTSRSA